MVAADIILSRTIIIIVIAVTIGSVIKETKIKIITAIYMGCRLRAN
jgi:hypothetical protein